MSAGAVLATSNGQLVDGRYPLLQRLGGSRGSEVYLTELPEEPSRKAVIKLIPADERGPERVVSRLEAIARLSHPNLIRIFRVGRCKINSASLIYVVMEYAEENLSQILPYRPLTSAETEEMLRAILDVLIFVHQNGFVHTHLKPSNVMAVGDRLKISSDNLQSSGEQDYHPAEPDTFDAPELGTEAVSAASDVWSLGMTLVAALAQNPPAWNREAKTEPVVPASIPQPFRGIARDCLRLDPRQRSTLEQVKVRLEPTSVSVARKRSRTGLLVAAQVILIALLATLWFVAHRSSTVKTRRTTRKQEAQPVLNAPTAQQHVQPAVSTPAPEPAHPPASAGNLHHGIVKGAVSEKVLPNVSGNARNTIQGKIRVNVRVDADDTGAVSAATLEKAGPSKYFARLALESARRWQFQPAQVDGKPVPSTWILHYRFGREETEIVPSETSP